ncbi:MAG: DoxX family membrane protein [Planctomycetota bacterium]
MRLGIGWHFYREGVTKIPDPSWTAAHFFTGSKGPLKPLFESLVWDVDAKVRLNYAETENERPTIDLSRTIETWDQYRIKVGDHYGFDEQQAKEAEEVFEHWKRQLAWYFSKHEDDVVSYFHGLRRRDANRENPARREVESLRAQSEKIEAELATARAPWLAQVEKLWESYEKALNEIATPEQRERGRVALAKPAVGLLDTNTIDRIVPYFDAIVGALLILGLFTRIAALAGAGFLFSIVLTQWPGAPGAEPVHYQAIEMLGMLVLAAMAAGQYAGLDYVLYGFWSKFKKSHQETNT